MVTRLSGTPLFAKSRLKKLIKAASGGLFYARQRVTTEGKAMGLKQVKRFKEDDEVIWSSQAGGAEKVKIGTVVEVIPAGKSILHSRFRNELDASTLPRKEESYIVCVGPKPGSRAKPKYYWPRTSALSLNTN